MSQTTEDGREREALFGAAKEEDGERGSEDDEEGAEDRSQALVTFEICSVLSQRNGAVVKDTKSLITWSLKSPV